MAKFNSNRSKMFNHSKQRWSLRKLSVGVASVLLGFAVVGVSAQADSTTSVSQGTTNAAAVQPAPAATTNAAIQQSQLHDTVAQNVVVLTTMQQR